MSYNNSEITYALQVLEHKKSGTLVSTAVLGQAAQRYILRSAARAIRLALTNRGERLRFERSAADKSAVNIRLSKKLRGVGSLH